MRGAAVCAVASEWDIAVSVSRSVEIVLRVEMIVVQKFRFKKQLSCYHLSLIHDNNNDHHSLKYCACHMNIPACWSLRALLLYMGVGFNNWNNESIIIIDWAYRSDPRSTAPAFDASILENLHQYAVKSGLECNCIMFPTNTSHTI